MVTETAIEWYSDESNACMTSTDQRFIKKILELKHVHDSEITIRNHPDTNDGCIVVMVPKSWVKIKPPIVRNFTSEQRAAMSERAKNMPHRTAKEACVIEG